MPVPAAEAHIRAYLDAFMESYARRDPAVMRSCFRLPLSFLRADGIRVIDNEDDFAAWGRTSHAGLDEQHFGRTDAEALTSEELNPATALVHLDFVRTNTSGEQYLHGRASYIVATEGGDDWRILAIIGRSR